MADETKETPILTPAEILVLKDMVQAQARLRWAGKWARNIALMVVSGITMVMAFGKSVREALGL